MLWDYWYAPVATQEGVREVNTPNIFQPNSTNIILETIYNNTALLNQIILPHFPSLHHTFQFTFSCTSKQSEPCIGGDTIQDEVPILHRCHLPGLFPHLPGGWAWFNLNAKFNLVVCMFLWWTCSLFLSIHCLAHLLSSRPAG